MVIKKTFVIPNPLGLHARTAVRISEVCRRFSSDVECCREGEEEYLDGKSVLDLMMLGAQQGESIQFIFRGSDAQLACDAVSELFANNLGE